MAMKRILLGLALATCLCAPAHAADIEGLLKQAESARSTDPTAFGATLDRLDSLQAGASQPQHWEYQLLRAYQAAMKGRYDLAIQQALAVNNETQDVALKFRSDLLIANTAAITRDFSLGLSHLETALAVKDRIQDAELRQTGYGVAAMLYNQYGQYALGQHYADQVLAQDPAPRNRCFTKEIRIEALYGLGAELDDSEINNGIADCDAQHEVIMSSLLRGYLARHWAAKGQTAKAIQLLEAHLAEVEASRYPRLIGEIRGLLAEYHLVAGDLAAADEDARGALQGGGNDAYSLPLVTAHKVLYEVALRRGNLPGALAEYRAYAEADKARLDEIKAREFAFHLSRNELQQKNQAIQLLSKQNEVLRLQQEVTKKTAQVSNLLIGLLGLVLLTGGYWAFKVKRVQKRFQHLAQTDALTGICNRAHLRQQAEAMLAECQARNRPIGMLVFDLDNFKAINDRHGHAGGDWVLEQVARACSGVCREGELFGRLGGEEFGIVVPDRDLASAERVAEACRAALATIDTTPVGERFTVTASFGCVGTALAGYDYERLLALADEAMYAAKHAGRDCIRRYGDAPARNRKPPVLVSA
ncbi:MAG: GGDEF domain-containing protein [Lysobacter sp.]|nr:GGDEF domain-containing protein [Lysobacter sp.]